MCHAVISRSLTLFFKMVDCSVLFGMLNDLVTSDLLRSPASTASITAIFVAIGWAFRDLAILYRTSSQTLTNLSANNYELADYGETTWQFVLTGLLSRDSRLGLNLSFL